MQLHVFEFIILILASFRLTRLIMYDKITSFIRKPFHEIVEEELPDGSIQEFLHIKGKGLRYWIGELLSCYWCTGIWCSAFLYFGYVFWPLWFEPLSYLLAIAGSASMLECILEKVMD